MVLVPQRLPTLTISADDEPRSRIACGTRSSCRITSALSISRAAFTVSNSGSPGPAPTRYTWPAAARADSLPCLAICLEVHNAESQIWRCASSCSSSLPRALRRLGALPAPRDEARPDSQATHQDPAATAHRFRGVAVVQARGSRLSSGNRNLEIAAAHNRAKEEVAVGNVVHTVAKECSAPAASR